MSTEKQTPLMQQYFRIREEYPDSLLLFQVGDFYELFFEDAKTASSFLAIALTKRGKSQGTDIPLCGIPVHALNHYLVKLIKGGFKVAICDQITEAKQGVMVERAVTRVLTPGTLTDSSMLDAQSASYLFSIFPGDDAWGMLFSELLTAQLFATSIPAGQFRMLEAELVRFLPDEVIIPSGQKSVEITTHLRKMGYVVSTAPTDHVGSPLAKAWVDAQFGLATQVFSQRPVIESSLHLLHAYLAKNQESSLSQFRHIQLYEPQDYLILDAATQKNLEVVANTRDGGRKNTLLSVLDGACTAMGSRTVKKWLLRPLVQKNAIMQRQEVAQLIARDVTFMQKLEEELSSLCDLERVVGRIGLNRAHLHDYCALRSTLMAVPRIRMLLQPYENKGLIKMLTAKLPDFTALYQLLCTALPDSPNDGHTIKHGFHYDLDRLRDLAKNGKDALLELEQREIARTGINSLKVGYSQITGYYLEVTNPNLAKVPDDYIAEQSLSNRRRFTTKELKALEHDLIKAHTQIDAVEKEVYEQVKKEVTVYLSALRHGAQALAYLDALFGFGKVAYNNSYVAPLFTETRDIHIAAGRHPVVEQSIGTAFIPNDTHLTDQEALLIITGPNMGGKSTYLRQVALLCIMAQCGSLVPAHAAQLPLLDRIFTRIGAGDDVAQGKSTFLVEMEETALICTQATAKSLVILDEVGRGTSTYDGMAIAQALIEYLYQKVKARCLFATHYHELTHLSEKFSGIATYYMKSTKVKDGILFLHELGRGVSQGSFGLEVAKLAQLPLEVVERAREILSGIESMHVSFTPFAQKSEHQETSLQQEKIQELTMQLERNGKLVSMLQGLDFDNITPKQALDILWEIKKKV